MQAASTLAASGLIAPVAPPLAPAGADQKNISPTPAQPLASLASAGIGQKKHFSRARSASGTQFEHRSVGNYSFRPRCPTRFDRRGYRQCSPQTYQPTSFFHSEAADVGSQASPAEPQAASREATANRCPVPVEPPALPQLPSISQARPPSLVPSDRISTRTRRRQAAAASSPRPAVDYGFDRPDPAPPPAELSVATT